MAWALQATQTVEGLSTDSSGNIITVTYNTNQIVNIIIYDGVSEYVPPDGTKLIEVAIGTSIGDYID